jgi:hypothetical protein
MGNNRATFFKRAILVFTSILLCICVGLVRSEGLVKAASPDLARVCKTDWMYRGMIGLATAYYPAKITDTESVANAFKVEKIATQLKDANASWFLLSLHHQSWIMMAPNATYDGILGNGSYTSARDVPLELHQQLESKGIKLMLYVNLRFDPRSAVSDKVRKSMGGWPPNDKLVNNIAAVYREFSLRYGNKVSGWWVDGTQLGSQWGISPDRERWFKIIADALRAGNPKALVSFNPGVIVDHYSNVEDYTTGESEVLKSFPNDRWLDGDQWHMWTYLGGWWNSNGTRFSDKELGEYISSVTSKGGALTFSVGTVGVSKKSKDSKVERSSAKGYIDPDQIAQLKRVLKYRRSVSAPPPMNCPN